MKDNIKSFDYIWESPLSKLNDFELEILRLNKIILTFVEAAEALKSISVHSSFKDISNHRYVVNSFKDKIKWEL